MKHSKTDKEKKTSQEKVGLFNFVFIAVVVVAILLIVINVVDVDDDVVVIVVVVAVVVVVVVVVEEAKTLEANQQNKTPRVGGRKERKRAL